jgi:hypothetical protein
MEWTTLCLSNVHTCLLKKCYTKVFNFACSYTTILLNNVNNIFVNENFAF